MRRSFEGLSYLVRDVIREDPLSGHLFLFLNRTRDKVKILYFDRTGFAIWYKELQAGTFTRPDKRETQTLLFASAPVTELAPTTEEISYTRQSKRSIEGKLPEGTRFPETLPREETIIDEGEGEVILEKVTERLAARPSSFYVKRIVRRVRKLGGALITPELPPTVIEGTTTDVSFLVYVLIAKYVWHLPLYRQEQILKAQGIRLSRDTLIRYVIAVASLLKPIYVAIGVELVSSDHLFADETPVLVGKKRGGAKKFQEERGSGPFWVMQGAPSTTRPLEHLRRSKHS